MMIIRVLTFLLAINCLVISLVICVKKKTKKHIKNVSKYHSRETNNTNSYSSNALPSPEPIIPMIAPPPAGGEHVYEDIMVLDMLSPPENGSVNF